MKCVTFIPPPSDLYQSSLEYPVGPAMLNFAACPSSDGELTPSVMNACAVPNPAAQICPWRGASGGNTAEQASHPGSVWMSFTPAACGATTVTCMVVAAIVPF